MDESWEGDPDMMFAEVVEQIRRGEAEDDESFYQFRFPGKVVKIPEEAFIQLFERKLALNGIVGTVEWVHRDGPDLVVDVEAVVV